MAEIELVKPDWIAGSEKRFFDFISKLGGEKICLMSHNDLDGISSAKVVNSVVRADMLKVANYSDLNDSLVIELKKNKIKKLIIVDMSVQRVEVIKEIEKFAEILWIDHHTMIQDINSEKTVFLNAQGFCAAYLCYYLFSKLQNLDNMDWLIACASIADWLYTKNKSWMKEVLEKYGDQFILEDDGLIKTSGKFYDLMYKLTLMIVYFEKKPMSVFEMIGLGFAEVKDLDKYSAIVLNEINNKEKQFEKEKEFMKWGYFWCFESKFGIDSILISNLSRNVKDKTFIFVFMDQKYCFINARRQDGKVDLPNLLRDLIRGFDDSSAGGHLKASGGNFPRKYLEEFKKRLKEMK
jgi:single-stranded DNA-specific DHH superfamily exonuclease